MSIPTIELNRLKKSHWSDSDVEVVNRVLSFVQLLMNEHDFQRIADKYENRPYKQLNPTITDGIDGVLDTISNFVKRFPDFSYDVKHAYVDGEFVIIHSHVTLKEKHRGNEKKGFNIVDKWRVQNGFLTEHWDSIQGISFSMRFYLLLTGGTLRNNNGIF